MRLGETVRRIKADNWYRDQYDEYIEHRDVAAERKYIEQIMQRPEAQRKGKWSASDSGSCLRRRQFTYLEMPKKKPNSRAMNIFANGDYVHIRHQAFGFAGEFITAAEIPIVIPTYNLRGTADAIASNGDGLEYKSINERGFARLATFGPDKKHIEQIHAYDLALDLKKWRLIYENKNTQDIAEFVIEIDPEISAKIVSELSILNTSTNQHELYPMLRECLQETGFDYTYCPYNHNCMEDQTWPTQKSGSSRKRDLKLVILPTSSSDKNSSA